MTIAQNQSAATLASNTGYDSQPEGGGIVRGFSISVDWLDFTFRSVTCAVEADQLVREFETISGERCMFAPGKSAFNGIAWDGSGWGENGSKIWYRDPHDDEFGDRIPGALKIAIPGSAIAKIDPMELGTWLSVHASETDVDCQRFDIALDDHEKFVKLGQIADARIGGNFFNCSYTEMIVSGKRGELEGVTLYFGSRHSDTRLRIYDKTIESKSRICGNRWEAQLRRKKAQAAFELWLSAIPKGEPVVCRVLQNIVLGIIDFRIRDDDDTDRNRCRPLIWFTNLLSNLRACPARLAIAKVEQSAQKSINWIKKSVAPTMLTLKKILGADFKTFMAESMFDALSGLSIAKQMMIDSTDKKQLLY
jgi:phage replication initiation protein